MTLLYSKDENCVAILAMDAFDCNDVVRFVMLAAVAVAGKSTNACA